MMMKCVVLLSGGLDSTTCLAIAKNEGYEVYALSFDYGQRHRVEVDAARAVAEKVGVAEHKVLSIDLRQIGGSALTDDIEVPKGRSIDDEIPVTYVPFRNAILLSFATAWAEVVGARAVFAGMNAIDYSGYPDCRGEFLSAFEKAMNLGTKKGGFRIVAPLLKLTKKEIVLRAIHEGAPIELTHSCYSPVDGMACGECDSCQLRLKGFREAGIKDPVRYHD
ncbi:MAG: 7-cyano-7-deazaguanine synthase QueC [archaeon]